MAASVSAHRGHAVGEIVKQIEILGEAGRIPFSMEDRCAGQVAVRTAVRGDGPERPRLNRGQRPQSGCEEEPPAASVLPQTAGHLRYVLPR